MEEKLKRYTHGDYVFEETQTLDTYLFYRKDGKVLDHIGTEPMDMYRNYMCQKIFSGEITTAVGGQINYQFSDDGKIMIITANILSLDSIQLKNNITEKENVKTKLKRIFKK